MSKTPKVPNWERVKQIFQQVLDQPPPERAAVLSRLCADDSGLRAEVQGLLAAHNEAGSFCEHPAIHRPAVEPAERSTLTAGTRLGHYEIVGHLGSGGMGEVYRAVDTRLGRSVAIKLLSPRHAQHRKMRARFDREAYTVARLNHPHICTLLDVGYAEDRDFIVFEYVEGQTLAHRLVSGPLAFPDLLRTAEEVLSALDHAHRNGVIHRDLTPTNILLTHEGTKVCDFGLASLKRVGQKSHGPSARPAETALTTEHEIVGTLQYMSPEQLEGHEADERSDIFSFGAVMYEMATGEKAFTAPSEARLIAAVLTSQPVPVTQRRPLTQALLDRTIQRCLAKDPTERWQSVSDVQVVLRWIATPAPAGDQPRSTRGYRIAPYLAAGAAAGLLLAVVSMFAAHAPGPSGEPRPSIAVTVPPPDEGRFSLTDSSAKTAQLAVSPDGRTLAFVASGADGISQIWIRRMDSTIARPVVGTADARYPFWSPNSRSLGFFAGRKLSRVDLDGGPARPLADAPNGRGGTWNAMNVILFAPSSAAGIFRINADGTNLAHQTDLKAGDVSHRWPQFLPDGRHFLFFARSPQQGSDGVYLASLDGPDRTELVESSFGGIYAPPGYVLYVADGTLVARTLDLAHARLTGEPVPIVTDVAGSSNFYGAFSASANGVLAYARNASAAELAWVDRQGRTLSVAAERAGYVDFQLSVDGRHLATGRVEPHSGHPDIHVLDLERGNNSRITSARETDASPVWSPDGTRLVFRSNRSRAHDLYLVSPSSSLSEELFVKSNIAKYPTDWSADGRRVIFHAESRPTGWDIWAASVDARGVPRPLVQTRDDEVQGHVSRDGRWLAYTWFTSTDTPEVYAKALEEDGTRTQISVHGGSDPHWSADGHELFYIADGMLMSVTVHPQGKLSPGKPRPLFRIPGARVAAPFPSQYDVDPSGQRFLVLRPVHDPQTLPLNVLVNWTPQSTPH